MQGAWPEEWVGPGVGKPLGRRALLTGSLLPPRHSAEPAPALKQQLLACEPTASHPCCGGDKGCHHPRPPPQPGLRSAPLPRPRSEAQAPPLAWLPLSRALLASAQFSLRAETHDPLENGPLLPGRPAVSSPGSTTPAFLGEGPRKFAFSSSGGHDLRNATRRSPLCFKKQDLGEDKSISTPSAVDHRSWKSE